MRALAMTGIVTASWMPLIIEGSDMRATPPSRRMSAGTRSSAMTAAAPADSAIRACSGVTTSMITPPLSISASPALTRNVARDFISNPYYLRACAAPEQQSGFVLLQAERFDAVRVGGLIERVDAVRERLDQAQERAVGANVGG